MSMQTVTLQIPEELYAQIRARAERSKRTVEDEFLNVVSEAIAPNDELPPELAAGIESLPELDDADLWGAARNRLSEAAAAELQSLHLKQQREGLTKDEADRAEHLGFEYDRTMLIRARAAALLKERGYDVDCLLAVK